MAILIATFALVLALVYGPYWALVEREEGERLAALRRRLKRPARVRATDQTLLKDRQRLSELGLLDSLLARSAHLLRPLERTIAQSGLRVTVGAVILASLCAAVLVYAVVEAITGQPPLGVVVGAGALAVPYQFIRVRAQQRLGQFEEQFPEAMDLLARALRAGHALTTGLSMVADEIGAPVGPEFRQLFDEQNFGRPLPEALKAFAERVPIVDARFFVTAVLTQREAGGNLSEVLDNLAGIIRERFRITRQVRVISAHGRITGFVLSALPLALGGFLAVTSGDAYRVFYTDPLGVRLIVGALVLQVIGVIIITRIVRVDY